MLKKSNHVFTIVMGCKLKQVIKKCFCVLFLGGGRKEETKDVDGLLRFNKIVLT